MAQSLDRPTVARVECYDLVLPAEAFVLATFFFVVLFLVAVFLVAFFALARRPDVVTSDRLVPFRVPLVLFDARFVGRTSLFRGLKRTNIS